VIRLAPLFRELSRQARVEIDVPNPDGELKPGMFARIDIELGRADNATWVPVQAIVKRQGNAGVFLVSDDGGTVRFIPTETGIEDGRKVQVLKPALSGRVVTLGHHLLLDKSKISIADTPSAGGSTE
jgi:multidrug efflux pump subunit AcrA (membrane-fusion protein)